MKVSFISWVGHRLREGIVHFQRITSPKAGRRIVMFPCGTPGDSCSRERAYNVGRYLRQLGWRVTIVPCQLELEQRRRILRFEKPDILFIQKGRHPLNFPKLYAVSQVVFDLDDADFLDPKQENQIIQCCEGSDLVICGSKYIEQFCKKYNSNTHVVWTGMNFQNRKNLPPSQRQNIVAWGTSDSVNYVGEREFLGEVMIHLRQKTDFEFWVYGVRNAQALETYVKYLEEHSVKVKLFSQLTLEEYHQSLEKAAVGLHPIAKSSPYSLGKSFGKLNSYMLCRVPIVVENELDYPNFFINAENAMLASDCDEWVEKIYQLLINPALRDKIAQQAQIKFQQELSSDVVAKKFNELLINLNK